MRLPNQIVPVYIVSGFLDSGKTSIIHNMLEDDGFSRGQKTLIVVCEEGMEEFDEKELAKQKTSLHMVDSIDEMIPSLFVNLNKQYKPERVIIEYNSVFTFDKLNTMQMPASWELVQIIATVDATTYENYMVNMRQLMTDPMQNADLVLFNRCEADMPISVWRRQIRAMNNNTNVLFEFTDGHSDDGVSDEDLPYDMKAEVVEVGEEHFGVFYLDAMDHPERYDHKILRFKGQAFADKNLPENFIRFGRYAMTCCADDIACLAFILRGDLKTDDGKYYTLTCQAESVYNKSYDRDIIALIQLYADQTDAPKEKYVTFG